MERATLPPASAEAIDAGCPAEAIGLASAFRPPEPRAKRGWVVSGGGVKGLAGTRPAAEPLRAACSLAIVQPEGTTSWSTLRLIEMLM